MVLEGSFPGFLTGTKLFLSLVDNNGPKIKPLASGPTITSGVQFKFLMSFTILSIISVRSRLSDSIGVMSLNKIPFIGKSGTVLIVFFSSCKRLSAKKTTSGYERVPQSKLNKLWYSIYVSVSKIAE